MDAADPRWCRRMAARERPTAPPPVPDAHDCDLCGTRMYEHNCKIVCPNCGYKRDCTDP